MNLKNCSLIDFVILFDILNDTWLELKLSGFGKLLR